MQLWVQLLRESLDHVQGRRYSSPGFRAAGVPASGQLKGCQKGVVFRIVFPLSVQRHKVSRQSCYQINSCLRIYCLGWRPIYRQMGRDFSTADRSAGLNQRAHRADQQPNAKEPEPARGGSCSLVSFGALGIALGKNTLATPGTSPGAAYSRPWYAFCTFYGDLKNYQQSLPLEKPC